MAYSADRRLLSDIRQSARALKNASTWIKSRQPVNPTTDFLYELYVLFRLAGKLSSRYEIIYMPGTGRTRNMFPKKPARKKDRPRFEVHPKGANALLYQICAGTTIKDIHGEKRAPDISLQKNDASDDPTYKDVDLIWDAKFRKNPLDPITHPELSEFGRWLDLLKLKNKSKPSLQASDFQDLMANCLITNGRKSTEPDAERERLDLKEVANFYPGQSFEVSPPTVATRTAVTAQIPAPTTIPAGP